jgi:hypothetical protein
MPEHVHSPWYPLAGAAKVEHRLKAIKSRYSHRIKPLLVALRCNLLRPLTIQQRPWCC